jgi:hypothetical protein
MTTESEYETEALSMLAQYGQTLNMSGNGLAKCPYEFEKEYFVGDKIKVAFSGKSATAQILSVTERWAWGNYSIQFSFGKPQNNLANQLQLMLRKIQASSNKVNSIESVKWYDVTTVTEMPDSDVTYNTIGFTGTLSADKTFTLYLDDEKTGAKSYNIYVKNLSGNYNLTLTTGVSGKSNFTIKGGQNLVARILVDEEGNIISQGMTATNVIEEGNLQPITSDSLATSDAMPVNTVTAGNMHSVTSNAVAEALSGKQDNITSLIDNFVKSNGYDTGLIFTDTAHATAIITPSEFWIKVNNWWDSQNDRTLMSGGALQLYITTSSIQVRTAPSHNEGDIINDWGAWRTI